jgi:hypothetical protein
VSDADKPQDSRFFRKPLEVKQMIELQEMVGVGALKFVPDAVIPLAIEALDRTNPSFSPHATSQDNLTAENDSLRLLLEQPVIDAKTLLAQAGIDAKVREAADKFRHPHDTFSGTAVEW